MLKGQTMTSEELKRARQRAELVKPKGQRYTIELSGELTGETWQGYTGRKEFNATFSNDARPFTTYWKGLKAAAELICNDGDFQECKISFLMITVNREGTTRAGLFKITSHAQAVKPGKALADYWTEQQPEDEDEDSESEN